MSEEQNTLDLEEPAQKESPTRGRKKAVQKSSGPVRVVCSDKVMGSLFDNERNVRIPSVGLNPVEVSDIREGSWLDCQIKAGLVTVLK